MAEPTSGEWVFESGNVVAIQPLDRTPIAHVSLSYKDSAEFVANGRLLVGAKELLAACKEAISNGKHAEDCGWWDHRNPLRPLIHHAGVCDCYLSRLGAAVAKAEVK